MRVPCSLSICIYWICHICVCICVALDWCIQVVSLHHGGVALTLLWGSQYKYMVCDAQIQVYIIGIIKRKNWLHWAFWTCGFSVVCRKADNRPMLFNNTVAATCNNASMNVGPCWTFRHQSASLPMHADLLAYDWCMPSTCWCNSKGRRGQGCSAR